MRRQVSRLGELRLSNQQGEPRSWTSHSLQLLTLTTRRLTRSPAASGLPRCAPILRRGERERPRNPSARRPAQPARGSVRQAAVRCPAAVDATSRDQRLRGAGKAKHEPALTRLIAALVVHSQPQGTTSLRAFSRRLVPPASARQPARRAAASIHRTLMPRIRGPSTWTRHGLRRLVPSWQPPSVTSESAVRSRSLWLIAV